MKEINNDVFNYYLDLCRAIMKANFDSSIMQLVTLQTVMGYMLDNFGMNTYKKAQEIIYKEFNL